MLDLYEVLDISERGVALHCSLPLEVDQTVELCLDLAEVSEQISGTARVAWLNAEGRVGLGLPILSNSARKVLSEWLFLNALAAAANSETPAIRLEESQNSILRQNYTDVLSAASAVQREAETLSPNLEQVLALVASRSRSLLRASGAAIALERKNPAGEIDDTEIEDGRTMICRASSGPSAPPVGATLHVGSSFSGECVRTGKLLRCDDSETDERADRQSCRALGLRSMLAAPVRSGEKVIGLIEVFSEKPGAFSENDGAVLQRLAETIQSAVNRSTSTHDPSSPPPTAPRAFSPLPGSVLFASLPEETAEIKEASDAQSMGGIRLPRLHLYLLIAAAATISLVLGSLSASSIQPWIQEKLHSREHNGGQTVLASSKAPVDAAYPAEILSVDSASLAQLREMADRGEPAAENALGLLYAAGDENQGIKRDESDAARWFAKAAEGGSVPAQSKLGALYWAGRGVAKDDNQAYFWTVLARANGDDASKVLAPFIAARLTPHQRADIEQQAEQWLERRESASKPVASR
jgi:TPR repeat protein/GAF domain-containing protein